MWLKITQTFIMKEILQVNSTFAFFLSLFLLVSCSPSENTIVIEEAPTSSGQPDTTPQAPEDEGPFTQLTIGENQPIKTLDPLFAENGSSMRALQLVYEGLVRFNASGEIIPAIAKDWTMSNNGHTYRFTLHNDIFYHDSNIFPNGRGRKLVAGDVKKAFERMARATVPDRAAQLFMNIEGFEPYYREQHAVLLPGEEQLQEINGIQTPNDSTVVFSLIEPDDTFLNKLATPYGLIYPHEAVTTGGFKAVGTGPFRLSQKRSDSLYIFAKFEEYRLAAQPKINRVDIQTSSNEMALLNALSRDNLQLIPQLGPRQMVATLNGSGQLKNNMEENYQLFETGRLHYFFRYNEGADIPKDEVIRALDMVQKDYIYHLIPDNAYEITWTLPQLSDRAVPDSISAIYASDPFINRFYSQLKQQLQKNGISFSVSSSRIPNRHISLLTDTYFPIQNVQMISNSALVAISVQSLVIAGNNLNNLEWNSFPWWINLRDVTLSSPTNSR